MLLNNQKGQGLIEYLIIVALVAVASIAMVKSLQNSVNIQLANAADAIGGAHSERSRTSKAITAEALRKKDFSNFMNGVATPRAGSGRDSNGTEASDQSE
jgi:Flp pilus assembly pilin Flp